MKAKSQEVYTKELTSLASAAFAHHQIAKQSEDRWTLRGESFYYYTEILVVCNGIVCLGDIETVHFKGGEACTTPRERLDWLTRAKDSGSYLREKACAGTGKDSCYIVDREVFLHDLITIRDGQEQPNPSAIQAIKGIISQLESDQDEHYMPTYVEMLFNHDPDYFIDRLDIGKVTSPRVFYALAAVLRLHHLLNGGK